MIVYSRLGGKIMSYVASSAYPLYYWNYMATVMSGSMKEILESKQIASQNIPAGVYADSCMFFDLAKKGKNYGLTHPRNREAHFTLAQYLWKLDDFHNVARKVIDSRIDQLHSFNQSLQNDRQATVDDLRQVQALMEFFDYLIVEGGKEISRERHKYGCF